MSDEVSVHATPENQLVEIETAVGDFGWGVRIGGETYDAPPMYVEEGNNVWTGISPNFDPPGDREGFIALWQMMVIDRNTTRVVSNKTYGWCLSSRGLGAGICENSDNGQEPFFVKGSGGIDDGTAEALKQQLADLGQERLVIALSKDPEAFPFQGVTLDQGDFTTGVLSEIGFPKEALNRNGAAVMGVPGMAPGDADYTVQQGPRHMRATWPPIRTGTSASSHSRGRRSTRASRPPSNPGGTCTVSQEIDGHRYQGSIADKRGGYLVTALDGQSLELEESRVFDTAGAGAPSIRTRR